MSFKLLLALVCAAAFLAAGGCASKQAAGSAPADSPAVSTTSSSSVVQAAADSDVWRSDVIVKIARDTNGGDAHGPSWRSTLSNDGRYVAFESDADDLVPGDTNRLIAPAPDRDTPALAHAGSDVFVFDRQTGAMELVSVARDGTPANGDSNEAHINATGRWVVFQSNANNLVPGDTNKWTDVFLHDRQTGTTELASVGLKGAAASGRSYARGVSADGRYVAFSSAAENLVPRDTNKTDDVFVRDMQAGVTERVSVGPGRKQGNKESADCSISADGRFVVFQSSATNLVPGDANGSADIFVRDREKGITERVSVDDAGEEANNNSWDCSISGQGRYVGFTSAATNLVPGDTSSQRNDAFVYDRQAKIMQRISVSPSGKEGNNSSGSTSISADGRYVAFLSFARNLVSSDTNKQPDVFVRDLETGKTWRVNLSAKGVQANEGSPYVALSGDGQWVAFMSHATNLVPGDRNRTPDVFVTKARR